jgi:hypothetical protein
MGQNKKKQVDVKVSVRVKEMDPQAIKDKNVPALLRRISKVSAESQERAEEETHGWGV